jgi:hypothetical protein
MNYGNTNNFMQPRVYFAKGFFIGNEINPDLLGKYARSSANMLMRHHVPVPILEGAYIQLFDSFEQEREYNNIEDLADIMRSRVFSEPFISFPFLMEVIDSGLLAVDSENDIEAFFVHFHKIIDLCKYSKLEGVIEY